MAVCVTGEEATGLTAPHRVLDFWLALTVALGFIHRIPAEQKLMGEGDLLGHKYVSSIWSDTAGDPKTVWNKNYLTLSFININM